MIASVFAIIAVITVYYGLRVFDRWLERLKDGFFEYNY